MQKRERTFREKDADRQGRKRNAVTSTFARGEVSVQNTQRHMATEAWRWPTQAANPWSRLRGDLAQTSQTFKSPQHWDSAVIGPCYFCKQDGSAIQIKPNNSSDKEEGREIVRWRTSSIFDGGTVSLDLLTYGFDRLWSVLRKSCHPRWNFLKWDYVWLCLF